MKAPPKHSKSLRIGCLSMSPKSIMLVIMAWPFGPLFVDEWKDVNIVFRFPTPRSRRIAVLWVYHLFGSFPHQGSSMTLRLGFGSNITPLLNVKMVIATLSDSLSGSEKILPNPISGSGRPLRTLTSVPRSSGWPLRYLVSVNLYSLIHETVSRLPRCLDLSFIRFTQLSANRWYRFWLELKNFTNQWALRNRRAPITLEVSVLRIVLFLRLIELVFVIFRYTSRPEPVIVLVTTRLATATCEKNHTPPWENTEIHFLI